MRTRSHAAHVDSSPRLQATRDCLLRFRAVGGPTTRDISTATGSMAVHSDIHELRENGFDIRCRQTTTTGAGRAVHRYLLVSGPDVEPIQEAAAPQEGRVRFPLADRGLVRREAGAVPAIADGGDAVGYLKERNGPGGPPVNASAESGAGASWRRRTRQLSLWGGR